MQIPVQFMYRQEFIGSEVASGCIWAPEGL